MLLMSWNVNGLRAVLQKGFMDFLDSVHPDLLGIQETKIQKDQIPPELLSPNGYQTYWDFAERKGYSGTALFTKIEPISISHSLGDPRFETEGRIVRADFPQVTLFNIYFPNGQKDDERLQFKLAFYDRCFDLFQEIRASGRHVIVCGDVNTAHRPIDLAHPKSNEKYSGFLPIERAWLDKWFTHGWVDTFRVFDDRPGQYSWWSYMGHAREKNVGWRIDYFVVDEGLRPYIKNAFIRPDIFGSDHCPIGLEIDDEVFR